jgi:hypothetical protein
MAVSPPRVGYCRLPDYIVAALTQSACVVRVDASTQQATFIDTANSEPIVTLLFGPEEPSSEMALVRNDSVEYTLPITQVLERHRAGRTKTPLAKTKPKPRKTAVSIDDVAPPAPPGPLAVLGDIPEWDLLRIRIEETLQFVKTIESGQDRMATLAQLAGFVVKATRARDDLADMRAALAAGRRRQSQEELSQKLYRLSLSL